LYKINVANSHITKFTKTLINMELLFSSTLVLDKGSYCAATWRITDLRIVSPPGELQSNCCQSYADSGDYKKEGQKSLKDCTQIHSCRKRAVTKTRGALCINFETDYPTTVSLKLLSRSCIFNVKIQKKISSHKNERNMLSQG
jgi:hypothetical protein